MGIKLKPLICIIAGVIAIIMQCVRMFEFFSIRMKKDDESKHKAVNQHLIDIVMAILFLLAAFLFIFVVLKEKPVYMLPFIMIGINYMVNDIRNLLIGFAARYLVEFIIDSLVTVVAIYIFTDLEADLEVPDY